MSLDLNNVSARYLWDIPRADLDRAVQISLALRRGCWSDMFPLPTPQHPPPTPSISEQAAALMRSCAEAWGRAQQG